MYEMLIGVSTGFVSFPSDREALRFKQLHRIVAPIPSADEWQLLLLRKLQQPAPEAAPTVPAAVPIAPNPHTAEARIRSQPTALLRQVAITNSVAWDPHPTNPGISAMRLRNALLAIARSGRVLEGL